MILHSEIEQRELRKQLQEGKLTWAGNKRLKIYGKLSCKSGKRMKRENRVFFLDEEEANRLGYRPCKHCCREKY